jgi:uncharacterized protein (DUF2126 family)
VAALGEEKLHYARRFARHLASGLYADAVVLQSFGKHYPGEPLPRWQIGVYRRRRGKAVWRQLDRLHLDQPLAPVSPRDMERRFLAVLAKSLKLRAHGFPAFEDVEAHLRAAGDPAAKRMLPKFTHRTRSFTARRATIGDLARITPLLKPAGWVLPLEHRQDRWRTGAWHRARKAGLALVPGDSPIGLRLPLNQLSPNTIHCALTVERVGGELVVFLPPCPTLESFCELVACVESAAEAVQLPPIRLQGYPPPPDPNLDHISLASDPGVIEVNLPPSRCWTDLEQLLRGVYDAAASSGLRGYKFHPRGHTVSTGGGAHIILAGPTLKQNPFVKRPMLLSSFLRFIQNHPSLSYVFSGLFTGPSCQGPRVDETVPGLLPELDITLNALETMRCPASAEQMDALLRNLLLDWNGNTHRAEVSVDKFYNAAAPNGRLGLVEFRAFEMMPAVELLLAPNALLRALAAAFAEAPYRELVIDWHDQLQDRFRLPWFLRADLKAVLDFLNTRGFAFQPAWFDPHLDFRFRVITRFRTGTIRWTLRQAIEPWPVMGDHTGTGRTVDASTDRLELVAEGWTPGTRLLAIVNGLRIPLKRFKGGVALAGIRYRLVDNPFGLQPHVKAHVPLQFEIVDPDRQQILHAFKYADITPTGPDGLAPPTTLEEARTRVQGRVIPSRPTRRKPRWREVRPTREAPFTLDLRRF